MFWFQLALVAVVLFVIAAVAAGNGGGAGPAYPDRPDVRLPADRPVTKGDVDRLRFSVGLRGYRMTEVDEVLDRLAGELAARDARIRELTGEEPYPAAEADRGPVPLDRPQRTPADGEAQRPVSEPES